MDRDDIVSELNKLIETCKDGEYGFRQCAENVKAANLKSTLLARAADCQRGASELQQLVVRYGGEPDTGGSATGAMHRGWVSVVGTLTGSSDHAILNECERGEDAALDAYRDAIKQSFPDDVAAVVRAQYEGAKRNHDQIRTLRDQTS